MNLPKEFLPKAAESVTKDLPLGKPGKRWTSGHRLSWRLTRNKEARQVLRDHKERRDERIAVKTKLGEMYKEGKQILAFPLPRTKEIFQEVDYPMLQKTLYVHPGSVTITESDLTKITPETLPVLNQKIKDMRATGESWANITLACIHQYTSHLKDPADKALKTGLVKAELRCVWNAEAELEKPQPDSNLEANVENDSGLAYIDLPGEWATHGSTSPHPNASQMLREHLHSTSTRL